MKFPGVVLSGGRSSRMGTPKALLSFGKTTLLNHIAERLAPQVNRVLLSSNDPAISLAGCVAVPDRFRHFKGPLAGIHAGMTSLVGDMDSAPTHLAVVTVDAPFFPFDLITRLAENLSSSDALSLAQSRDQLHPLIGLWPLSALPALEAWLTEPPSLKVRAFFEGMQVDRLSFADYQTVRGPLDPFFNINIADDLATAIAFQEVLNAH